MDGKNLRVTIKRPPKNIEGIGRREEDDGIYDEAGSGRVQQYDGRYYDHDGGGGGGGGGGGPPPPPRGRPARRGTRMAFVERELEMKSRELEEMKGQVHLAKTRVMNIMSQNLRDPRKLTQAIVQAQRDGDERHAAVAAENAQLRERLRQLEQQQQQQQGHTGGEDGDVGDGGDGHGIMMGQGEGMSGRHDDDRDGGHGVAAGLPGGEPGGPVHHMMPGTMGMGVDNAQGPGVVARDVNGTRFPNASGGPIVGRIPDHMFAGTSFEVAMGYPPWHPYHPNNDDYYARRHRSMQFRRQRQRKERGGPGGGRHDDPRHGHRPTMDEASMDRDLHERHAPPAITASGGDE